MSAPQLARNATYHIGTDRVVEDMISGRATHFIHIYRAAPGSLLPLVCVATGVAPSKSQALAEARNMLRTARLQGSL